jgi:hypothetical protein
VIFEQLARTMIGRTPLVLRNISIDPRQHLVTERNLAAFFNRSFGKDDLPKSERMACSLASYQLFLAPARSDQIQAFPNYRLARGPN